MVLGGDLPDGGGHVPHRAIYQSLFGIQGQHFPGNLATPGDAHIPLDLYYISPVTKVGC